MPLGGSASDIDALSRHPLPYWGLGVLPLPGKILKFSTQNNAMLCILARYTSRVSGVEHYTRAQA